MLKTTDGKLKKTHGSQKQTFWVVMDLADYELLGNKKVVNFDAKIFAESVRDHKKMLIGELIERLPQRKTIRGTGYF
jgi:hypothetical protein